VSIVRSNLTLTSLRRTLLTGFALSALSLAIAPGIASAESDPTPAPSATTPAWYSTAEGAAYSPASYPNPFFWTTGSDNKEYLKVSYWGPGGRGPGPNQPDATLRVISSDPERASVSMSQSQFSKDISLLTDGFVLPDSNGARQSVAVRFDGFGDLTLSRPSMPADCSVDDPTIFTGIPVVALGQNQRKYLLNIDVTFANRTAERTAQCAKTQPTVVPVDPNQSGSIGTNQGYSSQFVPPQTVDLATPLTDGVRATIIVGILMTALLLFIRHRFSPPKPVIPPVFGSDELPRWLDHQGLRPHPDSPALREWLRNAP
jgi:hypothetical protein